MQQHHIAPITAGQLDILVQLEQQTFTETFDGVYTPEDLRAFLLDKKSKEVLAAEMNAPGALFFLVWYEQQPAGLCLLLRHGSDE